MSIVNPSVLDLLERADSRYTLVVLASKRGRQIVNANQLLREDKDAPKPIIQDREPKPLKIAVDELDKGMLSFHRPDPTDEEMLLP